MWWRRHHHHAVKWSESEYCAMHFGSRFPILFSTPELLFFLGPDLQFSILRRFAFVFGSRFSILLSLKFFSRIALFFGSRFSNIVFRLTNSSSVLFYWIEYFPEIQALTSHFTNFKFEVEHLIQFFFGLVFWDSTSPNSCSASTFLGWKKPDYETKNPKT